MKISVYFSPGILTEMVVSPPEEVNFLADNYLYCEEKVFNTYQKKFITKFVPIFEFMDPLTGLITIPSGLVKWFLIELIHEGVVDKGDLEIVDVRGKFDSFRLSDIDELEFIQLYNEKRECFVQLRQYQVEGIKTLLSSFQGILCFPTSSGKGEIIVAISKILQKYGQVLVLVPSMSSLQSTKERFDDYGIKNYTYHKVRNSESLDGVIISTPKIIYNDLQRCSENNILKSIKYLLTNEVHHVQAKTWFEVSKELPSVVRSYGFSATPDITSEDSLSSLRFLNIREVMIIGTHGNIVMEVKSCDIKKYIEVPECLDVVFTPDYIPRKDMFKYDWLYMRQYLNHPVRLEFVSNLVQLIHKITDFTTITFVSFIETQGNPLLDLYPEGTVCWFGGGNVINNVGLDLNKDNVFDAIKNRQVRHTIVTSHAREDINLPVLNVAILLELANKKSVKQCVGRVVRKGSPSYFVNIFDTSPKILEIQAKKRSKFIASEYGTYSTKINNFKSFSNYFKQLQLCEK